VRRRGNGEAILISDLSGLGGYIVLLDGRTTLRNQYATLSNQQRKSSFKFGTSDELGSVILLLEQRRPTAGKPKPHARSNDP
jgi:hypothetical protein